jgi:hypothetical protein
MNQTLYPAIVGVMQAARNTGLFVSLASFYQPSTTQGPTGNPTGAYTPVAGLQNIPCMDAPEREGQPAAHEQKSIDQILAEGYRHVLLNAYYAAAFNAAESGWRVYIDGTAYDLTGAEADSQRQMTRLRLQRVEV